MVEFDKIVIVTKKTLLEELIERFNTRDQARFYIEHSGASFDEYQAAHEVYVGSLRRLKEALPREVRCQFIDRSFLPTFLFGERDLVVTLGPDGLVVNTAKYLTVQTILALNPDPDRIDGILVPFTLAQADRLLQRSFRGEFRSREISMAKATLNDGQVLYAVNDLFVGQRTHVSARYRLVFQRKSEDQSSSGIIVSTGAGSTGWFRSIITGAACIMESYSSLESLHKAKEMYRFDWESDYLYFNVREPFISKISAAQLVFGRIDSGERLEVVSHMPQNGVIFSDGIEADYLQFNSGSIARIELAEKRVHLISQV